MVKMRKVAMSIALVLSLAGMLAVGASIAAAHANYERSEPADGAVLPASPPSVEVWFTQELRRSGGLPTLVVVNSSGDAVDLGAVLDDNDRHRLFADLPPALPPGR
jgi:methionine-rich copper-binding protein CopC